MSLGTARYEQWRELEAELNKGLTDTGASPLSPLSHEGFEDLKITLPVPHPWKPCPNVSSHPLAPPRLCRSADGGACDLGCDDGCSVVSPSCVAVWATTCSVRSATCTGVGRVRDHGPTSASLRTWSRPPRRTCLRRRRLPCLPRRLAKHLTHSCAVPSSSRSYLFRSPPPPASLSRRNRTHGFSHQAMYREEEQEKRERWSPHNTHGA